jgi:glycosyltransferase involved in cell wall biosynthesis
LNKGIELARHTWIARMDADDRAEPERLAEQVGHLEREPEAVLVGTHVRYFPRAELKEGARRYERWLGSMKGPADLERDLWVECPLAHLLRGVDLFVERRPGWIVLGTAAVLAPSRIVDADVMRDSAPYRSACAMTRTNTA